MTSTDVDIRLIPIAAIITPATLSTRLTSVMPVPISRLPIPHVDFEGLATIGDMLMLNEVVYGSEERQYSKYGYSKPSQILTTTAGSVVASAELLLIQPPSANSSWEYIFPGPSIKCNALDDNSHQRVRKNLAAYLEDHIGSTTLRVYRYMSWHQLRTGSGAHISLPFVPLAANDTLVFDSTLARAYSNTIYIYVAASSVANRIQNLTENSNTTIMGADGNVPDWLDGSITECKLYESTYDVTFHYRNNLQDISIDSAIAPDSDPLPTITDLLVATNDDSRTSPCPSADGERGRTADRSACVGEPAARRKLSYQAIFDAFSQTVQGSIYDLSWQPYTLDTGVLDTALVRTRELSRLRRAFPSLQNVLASRTELSLGVDNSSLDEGPEVPLANTLETMFENLTVSLMASPLLQ